MAGLLNQHIAVITGAGSGIGRAIALAYAKEGAKVVILDADDKTAAATAQDIKAAGGAASSYALDVTKREACFAMAKRVADEAGPVTVLVNNAGINRRNPFAGDADTMAGDWNNIMAVNLDGVFNVTQAFLPQIRAAKGRIVNMGSMQSFLHVRTPSSAAYTASKHAVLGFTRALAAELGKDGVRVNAIGPGLIATPLNEKMRSNPELLKVFIDHTPLGRVGTPEDIANAAVFLASDMSSFVTGTLLMVDGGYRTI
jgi:NAD(P)-dependent dehydrogenase (short-subunit alcohol dehydrogenase family)